METETTPLQGELDEDEPNFEHDNDEASGEPTESNEPDATFGGL